ncbi:MAG TPA: hypothetical protein VJB15_10810 [Rhodothermia bacterium]|nr:hypothetical protein [Rhodothermia bacterium]
MRFLGVGETNDLGDMYLRLIARGHEVRVSIVNKIFIPAMRYRNDIGERVMRESLRDLRRLGWLPE